jgi:hypothetical protein
MAALDPKAIALLIAKKKGSSDEPDGDEADHSDDAVEAMKGLISAIRGDGSEVSDDDARSALTWQCRLDSCSTEAPSEDEGSPEDEAG